MAIIRMNVHGLVLYDVRESYEEVANNLSNYSEGFLQLHRRDHQTPVMLNRRNIMDVFPSNVEKNWKELK
jgi:hypothetical protein